MSNQNCDPIVVGKLGATYGIKGWLKVFSYTEHAESIFQYQPWKIQIKGQLQTIEVEAWKRHGQGLVVKLAGYDVREDAQFLTNIEIVVDADKLPELPNEEIYWRDLYGMSVVSTEGYDMGVIVDILETGSNDVLVVKANAKDAFGQKERLIPFLDGQVIKSIDRAVQRIEVDWDPGF